MADHETKIRIIACGALAREIMAVTETNKLVNFDVTCLPALWHNSPDKITPGVKAAIDQARQDGFDKIFIAYGDCGTGGALDRLCAQENVTRIEGPHCYAFYSGLDQFAQQSDKDMRSFFLTDFLTRQFRTLIIEPYRLEDKPDMIELLFGHYQKLVYLAQTKDEQLQTDAKAAADFLGLSYEYRFTGYGALQSALIKAHG